VQSVPDMALAVDLSGDRVTLGPVTLGGPLLHITSDAYFNTFDNVWATRSYVRINNVIRFTAGGNEHSILITSDIGDPAGQFVFEASMDQPIGEIGRA